MNPTPFVSRLTRKSRSNFFYAFLCLPRPQREALYRPAFLGLAEERR